jgi:hypothetical protein
VQGDLQTVYRIKELGKRPRPEKKEADPLIIIIIKPRLSPVGIRCADHATPI